MDGAIAKLKELKLQLDAKQQVSGAAVSVTAPFACVAKRMGHRTQQLT